MIPRKKIKTKNVVTSDCFDQEEALEYYQNEDSVVESIADWHGQLRVNLVEDRLGVL